METACFKYIRKKLQGTNWTVLIEKTGVFICVGEMERKMRAFLSDHLIYIYSSCNIHFHLATIFRKARGDSSFFLFFSFCFFISSCSFIFYQTTAPLRTIVREYVV